MDSPPGYETESKADFKDLEEQLRAAILGQGSDDTRLVIGLVGHTATVCNTCGLAHTLCSRTLAQHIAALLMLSATSQTLSTLSIHGQDQVGDHLLNAQL